MTEGVVYVAYGGPARDAAHNSIETLRKVSSRPILILDEDKFPDPGFGARWAKLNIDLLVPQWEYVLYLDADTLVHKPIDIGFEILKSGWDMVIIPSINQGVDSLCHLDDEDRVYTQTQVGPFPVQLQGGVFWFNQDTCKGLFETWRIEWQRFRGQDQGALLRALKDSPVKIWLLGRPFNALGSDSVVQHLFGGARH